ncbi:MAG: sulfatase-like hydrolase/transferase [Pseudobutyrivibrio sp.]|nr:sulfatase-like hydrolase/transferase [Pseudobutyrivibrio sp.]
MIKFILSIILTLLTYTTTKEPTYIVVGLVELAFIFIVYNLLIGTKKWARLVADGLLFIYNAQMLVLYFGNSFTTLTMLKNVKFLQDLGGKIVVYLIGALAVIVFTFWPMKPVLRNVNRKVLIGVLAVLLIAEIGIYGNYKRFSPVQSFATIFADEIRYQHVKRAAANPEVALATFYQKESADVAEKPGILPEQPNIILIFTEGLSYNIVSDERQVMPNLQAFEQDSISFKNYYNHTFPTLRGVQGQLFSGYKLNDDAQGNNLVSLHGTLKEQGYSTTFINVEPFNEEFVNYCDNLGFDQVVMDKENVSGLAEGMTDYEAYNLLMDTAQTLDEGDEPFLLSIYTFGTHVSFDSDDNQFGDGKSPELNKFHNLDREFGEFLDEFKASPMAEDTILIFTTDHATYADQDFTDAFPDYKRECTDLDAIPFFIYYKGLGPEELDVEGKNSLCLTPTILDLLDINTENYFLGSSLFDKAASTEYDTIFYDASYLISTKDGKIRYLEDLEIDSFLSQVLSYFSALEASH